MGEAAKDNTMTNDDLPLDEEFVRLALAINEHLPGYVDSYFGPTEWVEAAKQAGQLPLQGLHERVDRLASNISRADTFDLQRRDFLAGQVRAMQMSLRLLSGEKVSLAQEVEALYDVRPGWSDESQFLEAQKQFDALLPPGDSVKQRLDSWRNSLEIPIDKTKELLPVITDRLRVLTHQKFSLTEDESFHLDFVSNEPWGAYNWYLGGYRSRIAINTDLPMEVTRPAALIAHEGYPGHHTELSMKEAKLIRQMNYREHVLTLINSPSCVISEGIATTALETVLPDDELEAWYEAEILPRAGMAHIDAARIMDVSRAGRKLAGLVGNAAFMFHDQKKSAEEIKAYLQKYGLNTEQEAEQAIKFISNPLYRSYIFTYHVGHDLLEELFTHGQRDEYFARLLQEPVTPGQIRAWIGQ
jgi:hypothetical protein